MRALLIISFFTLFSSGSMAQEVIPAFELREEADALSEALAAGGAWHWDLIRVRLILEAGIEIPLITDFKLAPEVEFTFVKQ